MSHNIQQRSHRMLKNRQAQIPKAPAPAGPGGPDDNGNGNPDPGNGNGGGGGGGASSANPGGGNGGGQQPAPTKQTTRQPPPTTQAEEPTTQQQPTSVQSVKETPSTTQTTPTTTSTTPTTTKTTSSSTGSATPLLATSTAAPVQVTAGGTTMFSVPRITNTVATSASASPSASGTATGSLNTGLVVGSVAGGIGGLVLLGLIIAFILRRLRNRKEADEFDAAQFRRSAVMVEDEDSSIYAGRGNPRPPTMIERHVGGIRSHHAVAPSISSSMNANIAGMGAAGAAGYGATGHSDASYGATGYSEPSYPVGGYMDMEREPAASAAAPSGQQLAPGQIQEREKYTFGEVPTSNHNGTSSHGHGSAEHDGGYDPFASGGQQQHYQQGYDDAQSQYHQYYAQEGAGQYGHYDPSTMPTQAARPSVSESSPYGGI